MDYKDKRVFVSGGSSGLGQATAVMLAGLGAHVCVAARSSDALEKTVLAMKHAAGAHNTVLIAKVIDVTDPARVEEAAKEVLVALGGLDLLVCNQGFAHTGLVDEVPIGDFKRLMEVNYLGHAYLCRAFAPHFIKQQSGTVLMVSSVLGYLSTYGYAAYSASKWAIVGFAEGLRQELRLYGVQVKVFYPGTIETPGLEQENADKPKIVWEMESNNPFNKIRSADDMANRLLRAALGSRFDNPVGWDGWFSFLASRYLSRLVRWLNDSDLKKAIKKHKSPD